MIADLSPAAAMDRRRRRLVWVRALRRALPVLAGATLLAVTGQVVWRGIRLVLIPEAAAPASAVRMVNPVFTGESRDGSRYRVAARSGVRAAGDGQMIVLDGPSVSVTQADGTTTRTTAEHGAFREDDMTLRLSGMVKVADDSGYRFTFRSAVFDTRSGRVVGQGVQGEGNGAQVRSEQYTVDEKGGTMVFKGRVRGRIDGR